MARSDAKPEEKPSDGPQLGWGSLLSMGLTIAAIIAIGLFAGWLVDRLTATSPTFLLIGLAAGIVAAVAYVVSRFRTYLKT